MTVKPLDKLKPATCTQKSKKVAPTTVLREVTLPKPSSNNGVAGPTLSPYERMRQLLVSRTEESRVINTVDDLMIHLTGADKHKPVRIRMRLIWVSEHTHKPWKFARLYFVDASAQESLEDMLQVFREPYEANSQEVDSLLLTATVWSAEIDSEFLPPPGQIVCINGYTNLKAYGGAICQLTTRFSQLSWEGQED
ncbi:hypothetical protein L914_21566 [Phytophthora nicotianae]|uniref:Uncharacterized protein n=6 Tax=Phytophthora nicotianae TaxID=4792 RepID=V9G020_PHYNI|nr:hypothetical protein F443_00560 [Phytophthora nicotianae P1569]ETM30759.1 hypothetical protein L914_21566 [Phytophthora nicotianae]ETO73948.1 hypothetical protein F444_10138 [Phytophthora nicotianae P1976]